jgi:hypothetical protein
MPITTATTTAAMISTVVTLPSPFMADLLSVSTRRRVVGQRL